MSGGYLRPSVNNKPLPRFYRQPIQISMIIRRRIKAKIERLERQTRLQEWLGDVKAEHTFQTALWEQGVYETEDEVDHMLAYGKKIKPCLVPVAECIDRIQGPEQSPFWRLLRDPSNSIENARQAYLPLK